MAVNIQFSQSYHWLSSWILANIIQLATQDFGNPEILENLVIIDTQHGMCGKVFFIGLRLWIGRYWHWR